MFERGFGADVIRQLLRFIDWMMELPPALDRLCQEEIYTFEQERRMPYVTSFERHGRREGFYTLIEEILQAKFGDEGVSLMAEVRAQQDEEKLKAVGRAAGPATSLDDVRRALSS